MGNAQPFPRCGGRVLCVHGAVSFHSSSVCDKIAASSDCSRPVTMFTSKPPTCAGRTLALPRKDRDIRYLRLGIAGDQTAVPNVHRDKACLVFANTAGKTGPGRSDRFGATSLILAKQTLFTDPDCHSTFCNGGERFRLSTLLAAQRDILFRERGACVHSFAQVNPGSLSAGAAGKTIALQNPFVFSLNDDVDPRAPSAPVPASTKWLNDELDEVRSLGVAYAASALAAEANAAHVQTVAGLRGVTPSRRLT